MRKVLLAVSTAAAVAVPGFASAQVYAADIYAPPAAAVVPGAPMVQSQVYLAPNSVVVAPGTVYEDQPIYINGQRYYRDCWFDWGRRRCELKPWW